MGIKVPPSPGATKKLLEIGKFCVTLQSEMNLIREER